VHYDLHYLNVLRDLEDHRWVVIDPLPRAGVPEVEVVPALRNRWEDLVATGDPERAMLRRFDLLTDAAGLDRELASAFAQAVAVDNLLWLMPREPKHMLVAPYTIISRW
jgi:streptomycin 6-kinase